MSMNEQEYLTPEGLKRLEVELEHLRSVRRVEVAQRLHEAMEEGEITENPEYEDAKNEQAFVEGRNMDIEQLLANAILIEPKSGPANEIRLGTKVTLTEVGTTDKEHYIIVGSAEADPSNGRISNESPLGRALIGKKNHEEVQVQTPGGAIKYKVTHVGNK